MLSITHRVRAFLVGFNKVPRTEIEDDIYSDDPSSLPDREALLSAEKQDEEVVNTAQLRKMRCYLLINATLLFASLVLFISAVFVDFGRLSENNYYLKNMTEYSPILDQLHIPLETRQMEATLLRPEHSSIFRQPPSREVDDAWERITNVRPIPVTREDVLKLGKEPEQFAKFPESFGFGPEAYMGRLDIFHVIHCVDQVRREAYFDHYYGKHWGTRANASELHKTHISHCVHIILQNIMCSPNLDVYLHFWADANPSAFPDFNVNHKCFDFERLLKWQEENSVDIEEFGAVRRLANEEPRKMTPEFKKLFAYEGLDQFKGNEVA